MDYYKRNIYEAPRGVVFKDFISSLLKLGNVKQKYQNELLTKESMTLFSTAFTHPSADLNNNYEILETLGDQTVNKCILWYLPRRFPQINCPQGKGVLSRLKINLIESKFFASLAEPLGFWDFVTSKKEFCTSTGTIVKFDNPQEKTKILEDVFEAFFAALEWILDQKFAIGVGYGVCYTIIAKQMDKQKISLEYNELYDSVTRLKQTFDSFHIQLGKTRYVKIEEVVDNIKTFTVTIIHSKPSGDSREIGKASSHISMRDAERQAAEQGLKIIEEEGYKRAVPEDYLKMCT